jgi:hypothetical protein
MNEIVRLPLPVLVIAAFLAVLSLLFIGLYLVPGLSFRTKIGRLLIRLKALQRTKSNDPARALSALFAGDRTLNHLWQEYRDTLHVQKETNSAGIQEVVATRATVPAEVFFSDQVLVDSRLRTEFFKHLPGILTGLGIIGTFLGLLQGLRAFRITEDTQVVRASLEALLHGVFDAFLVSAAAIGLAMLVTVVEKWVTSGLYRQVEELAFLLDSMFASGAGEEYLARLVRASEESASQTRILKDALVADLKAILSEMTDRQINASAAGNLQLGQHIIAGLETSLQAPLSQISGAVKQIGGSQADAMGRVLTDSIAALTQRIQELFGGQIAGINQLQQQTIEALQTAVAKLGQLVSSMDSAGQNATEAMANKLTEALGAMGVRQRLMNGQMSDFVDQIRGLVRQSQTETNEKLQETVSLLGSAVSEIANSLRDQADLAARTHVERERAMTETTAQVVTSLGGQVEAVLERVSGVSGELRASIEALRSVTTDTLNRMNSGAETLYVAAGDFAKAGQGVGGVLAQATNVADKLSQAAGTVGSSARVLEAVVADYKATREVLAEMLVELGSIVDSARKEASLTADVLSRIEGATGKFLQAQKQADAYLESVSKVLGDAHQEFADNMRKTVGEANRQFYDQLSRATALLREGIQELETTLSELGVRK